MSISSYYKKQNELFTKQKREREILLAHGIKVENIDMLHMEDYKAWKADRIYSLHNNVSSDELGEDALSQAWLRRNPCDGIEEKIGGFLDSIENEKLSDALKALTSDELALIEACLINGIPQNEYARQIGRAPSSVNEKLNRLRKLLCKKIK